MSTDAPAGMPPRPGVYPGGTMPDNCIGGQAPGSGTAQLLDAATGQLAGNVMDNSISLFRYSDGNWYYRFDGVPDGNYRVEIVLDSGTTLNTGTLSPGSVGNATS